MTRGGGNREPSGSFEARQQRLRRRHAAAARGQKIDAPPQHGRLARPSLGRRIWSALSALWRRSR